MTSYIDLFIRHLEEHEEEQVNTEACFEILLRHSRKFRRYLKKRRKKKNG